jgi:hypothetical protein
MEGRRRRIPDARLRSVRWRSSRRSSDGRRAETVEQPTSAVDDADADTAGPNDDAVAERPRAVTG